MSNNKNIRTTSQQMLAAISLAGHVAMNQPGTNVMPKNNQVQASEAQKDDLIEAISSEEHDEIMSKMIGFAHMPSGHLDKNDEMYLEQQLTDMLGFEVAAELDGHRLNHTIGIMGGEQHLKRFPTDDLSQHDAYTEAGIAGNRGAFGWFTKNGELTPKAIAQEKYYFAVQTLYLPDWNQNHKDLKPWYKFRKMIVVNPSEQVAVVGVVGDAGPSKWVQKQFGGSPEIIREGKIWTPKTKGHILMFFVDDPNDEIPLGVIDLSWKEQF